LEIEIELLLNILPTLDDDYQHSLLAKRIIELNEELKLRAKRAQSEGLGMKNPISLKRYSAISLS